MKELIFAIQFLLSQELFYTEDGISRYPVDGKLGITTEKVYFVIDGITEEYDVTAINIENHRVLVTFAEEGVFGTLIGTEYVVRLEAAYFDDEDGTVDWVKVEYRVKNTNLRNVTKLQ